MHFLQKVLTAPLALLVLCIGCAGPSRDVPDPGLAGAEVDWPLPVDLEFLTVYENVKDAPYFPIEGIAGVTFTPQGTLVFCDEKGGRVHALDPMTLRWYRFDTAGRRYFRPVDVCVDQFNILVLDVDGRFLLRYDMNGSFLGRLIEFNFLDPGYRRQPVCMDIDVDGRMVFADVTENQILMVDDYLTLQQSVGGPGSHPEQFKDPGGITYLPDGGFVVSDSGNRRLQKYNRLGYHEAATLGEFDPENPLILPKGIDADTWGNLFVADPLARSIHVYTYDLRYLFSLGSELGLLASPESPVDVAVGPDDVLAVTDRGRQAILVYRIIYQ